MIKKFSSVMAVILILVFSVPAFADSPNNANNGYIPFGIDLSYLADNPPKEVQDDSPVPLLRSSVIPAKYDLRNVDGKSYVTSLKNQNPYGTCWAYASIGAMESNYLKQGGSALDLSEQHLAWFAFRNQDKSKAFYNLSSASFKTVMDHGGNAFYTAALFGRLDGPVLESDVPYGTQPSNSTPDAYENHNKILRLRDVSYLSLSSLNINDSDASRKNVKQRIIDNGSVLASYYNNDSDFKRTELNGISYYNNTRSTNHAVQIIGWDDNYSSDNFKTPPSMNGAWLIKNSWGNVNPVTKHIDNSYDGCFWMSYEQYLTDGTAFIVEEAKDDMKAYYYDALGWTGTSGQRGTVMYFANVFKSERDNENLTEVAFYTTNNNIDYEINIYTGIASTSSTPISGVRASSAATSGTIPFAGYHTITLNSPVALTKGQYFSVVVKFKCQSSIGVPLEYKGSSMSPNASIETGSFISTNGTNWSAKTDANVCVRAFTETALNSAPKITTESLPDALLGSPYSYKVTASGSRPLTWSITGSLPKGLEFDNGTISGTPTGSGGSFTLKVSNSKGTDSKTFTLNIIDQPEIVTKEITGYVGYQLNKKLELSEGTATSWSITSGTLPKGLSLSTSGIISGKPTKKNSVTVTVKALSTSWTVSKSITINILAKPKKPNISTSKLKDGEVNETYSEALKITGDTPITVSASGLPSGLSMSSSGVVSGTPTVTGNFEINVTAENIYTELENKPVTKKVRLKIKAKPPVFNAISVASMPMAVLSKPYQGYTFTLSQGTEGGETITWSASGLPSGMSITSTGKLIGTPAKAGNFKITIKAKNSAKQVNSEKIPFTVYQIPEVSTKTLSNATTGKKYTAKIKAVGTAPMSWKVEGLPDTLTATLDNKTSQLTVTGTPTSANTYSISFIISNAAGTSETKTLSLTVNGVAPKIKASLVKATTDSAYAGSGISATGTLPIEFSYSISDSDKTKFGINSLEEIGLSLSTNPVAGTAEITGTPNQSVKNLPIAITATNVKGSSTKKISFTAKGNKPAFGSSVPETMSAASGGSVSINVTVTGSKKITFSMNKINGLEINQTSDYSALISGTAPSGVKKLKIKVTAANADGKVSKTITINTDTSASDSGNTSVNQPDSETKNNSNSGEALNTLNPSTPDSVKMGTERGIKSLGSKELDVLEGYTIAALMPELSTSESGMYDFEVDLDPEIEANKELFYFAFVKNREKNDDDEIVEFFDTEGKEITRTTDEHEILISIWLNSGDIYAPVIAVKDKDAE